MDIIDSHAQEPLLGDTQRPSDDRQRRSHSRPRGSFHALGVAGAVALLMGILLATVSRIGGLVAHSYSHASRPRMSGLFPFRDVSGHAKDCSSPAFTKSTLKVLAEYPIVRLMQGSPEGTDYLHKFEASDVAARPGTGNPYYVVLDNSFSVLRVGEAFHDVPGSGNALMQWPEDDKSDSQFEALAYNMTSDSFIAVQEVVEENGKMRARMFDIKFTQNSTVISDECDSDFEFTHENKGFEGAVVVKGPHGIEYLLGLCEGNFCEGGRKGRRSGHGRLVVLERTANSNGKCSFKYVDILSLPRSCNFMDYSAVTIFQGQEPGENGEMMIAVASQENGALWVSTITPGKERSGKGPLFEFAEGTIYDFPTNDNCEIVYCNVEGVHFIDNRTILAVSDAMKSKGRQDFRCFRKAQSVHLMSLP